MTVFIRVREYYVCVCMYVCECVYTCALGTHTYDGMLLCVHMPRTCNILHCREREGIRRWASENRNEIWYGPFDRIDRFTYYGAIDPSDSYNTMTFLSKL